MNEEIVDAVESYWARQYPALEKLVAATGRQIDNILVLDDYYDTARTGEKLKKAVGLFGAHALDLGQLSTVLGQASGERGIQKLHRARIQTVSRELKSIRKSYEHAPPASTFIDFTVGVEAVLEGFENHIGASAKLFRLLRIARLEAKGKYDPAVHDAYFERFNWRQFDSEEMALCPPYVVLATPQGESRSIYGELVELMTSGKPLNVALCRTAFDSDLKETGRAAAIGGNIGIELLFIALRNIYVAQGSSAGNGGVQVLLDSGLASPRPALLSVFCANGSGSRFPDRAKRALRSRAFPQFIYDPDKSADFVACLDLSQNPDVEATWTRDVLEYLPVDSKELERMDRAYTYSDFSTIEPGLSEHFTPLDESEQSATPIALADYLELTPEARRGHVPFTYRVDEEHHLHRWTPSQSMVAQTADRLHLWRSLQELGGICNPYVQAAEKQARDALTAEKDRALAELQNSLNEKLEARAQSAVAEAMQRLARKLTGMDLLESHAENAPPAATAQPPAQGQQEFPTAGAGAGLQPDPATSAAANESANEVAGEAAAESSPATMDVSETPWIEDRLCTACDDCTDINKKIFAYNAKKKAIIADAQGGPYRDIVRAAEKCASDAIRPGLPWDPDEKDLEKWIKRAEPYQ